MRRLTLVAGCVAAVVLAMGVSEILAASITVNASTDVWVREIGPDMTFENDGISVWYPGCQTDQARKGAMEFDISGVTEPITSAYIRMYDVTTPGHSATFSQTTSLLSPNGIASLTWNGLSGYTETALESLGSYNLSGSTSNTWVNSAMASAADVSALEALRAGSSKTVTVLMTAGIGERDWNDVNHGYAPQLVLNGQVPEPSSIILLVTGLIGLVCYAWRKR